jgi:hypothetical protein
MNADYTFDMMHETVEGLLLPVFRQAAIPSENIRALWGISRWIKSMTHQLAGEG